jgi:uncharacterized membrane protein
MSTLAFEPLFGIFGLWQIIMIVVLIALIFLWVALRKKQ